MAYQYTQGLAQNTADFCKKLYTFAVTTTGWTVIQDSSFSTGGANSTNTYLAISSTGESGTGQNVIQLQRGNANQLTGLAMLSYVTGGPPGTRHAFTGSTSATFGTGTFVTTDDNGAFYYWVFGSLDRFVICTAAPSRIGFLDTMYIGAYTTARSSSYATCTNAPAAGTSVTFSTTNTSLFTVGKRYTICDANNFETPKVTAIVANTSVTLDVLNNSYAIGAKLGEDPRPGIVTASSNTVGWQVNNWPVVPPMRQTLASPTTTSSIPNGEFVVDTISTVMLERASDFYGLDGGADGGGGTTANGLVDLWVPYIYDGSIYGGGLMGNLTEVYFCPRHAAVTDDTITVGGNTYHYLNTAHPVTATSTGSSGGVGLAIRRA